MSGVATLGRVAVSGRKRGMIYISKEEVGEKSLSSLHSSI
jgi:hypothetical protein